MARQQAGAADAAVLDALIALQNADGSFGATAGHPGNAQDTAWALHALAASRASGAAASQALGWLVAAQQADGAWPLMPDGDAIVSTALAVQALTPYRQQPAAREALAKARAWLTAQRDASQSWSSDLRTAQALLAVLPGLDTAASMQAPLAALRQSQRSDGSWAGDPHLSALALHALWLAGQPATNPDLASVAGIVVDENDQPIASALVRLRDLGTSTTTDSDGAFQMLGLPTGSDTLEITATGYRPLVANVQLQAGQQVDFGHIRMALLSGAGSQTVTISGVARISVNNGSMIYPAGNARISAGGQITQANSKGEYTLTGLPPGHLTVLATHLGSPDIEISITAQAGDQINFDPLFIRQTANSSLKIHVKDKTSGLPIPGASVNINDAPQGSTDANGTARFFQYIVGRNSISVRKNGYESYIASIHITNSSQDIDLTFFLNQSTNSITKLVGIVTDQATQAPIKGAKITIEGVTGAVTETNAQGEYELTSPPEIYGNQRITIEYPEYQTLTYSLMISRGFLNRHHIQLNRKINTSQPSSLEVQVFDAQNNQPIANSEISLSGSNTATKHTNSDGEARINNLNVGDTSIQISANGYTSSVASVRVQMGNTYHLPVPLHPVAAGIGPRLSGQVIDAASRQPLAGVQITLSGPTSASVTSDLQGHYTFDGLSPGVWQLDIRHANHVDYTQTLDIQGDTQLNIALQTSYSLPAVWSLHGTVIDDSDGAPIPAKIITRDFDENYPIDIEKHLQAKDDGSFSIDSLQGTHLQIFVESPGYENTLLKIPALYPAHSIGYIRLRRLFANPNPELVVSELNSNLLSDPETFIANGTLQAQIRNSGGSASGDFTAIAFIDVDGNAQWDPSTDTLLSEQDVTSLLPQETHPLSFALSNVALPFRDAPVAIWLDKDHRVLERNKANNFRLSTSSCTQQGVELAICMDTSGSVGYGFRTQIQGLLHAIDSQIIPHDGSVRLSVYTADQRFKEYLPPTIVEPGNLQTIRQTLEAARPWGGDADFMALCTKEVADRMAADPNAGAFKTITVSGDGVWPNDQGSYGGGYQAALEAVEYAAIRGVDRMDAIGISTNPSSVKTLQAHIYPKIGNWITNYVEIQTSNAYGEAIAKTFTAQLTSTSELSVGGLRIVDNGAGALPGLSARVGNSGQPSKATTVRFYQGPQLLAEVPVPALTSGAYTDVQAPHVALTFAPGATPIHAVVDEPRLNAECNLANNIQHISTIPSNLLAAITVATDQPIYPSQSPVQLSALVRNLGSFDAALSVALQVRDAQGQSVAQFPPHALGQVAAGAQTPHTQAWHTGTLSAGGYTLHGQVLAPGGQVLAQAFTPFAIAANGPGAPAATLGVATDRAQYSPDERVRIDALARNLTANAAIDDARITLEVRDPQDQLIASHTLPVGQLAAGALRAVDVLQPLRQAPLGAYTIAATLIGSGRFHGSAVQDVALASASTRFQVVAQGGPGPSPGAQADYSISKSAPQPAIATGGQARWIITVANQGPHDGHGVLIEDALPAGLTHAQWTCSASGQAQCGRASGQGPVQLDALIPSGAGHAVTIVVTATAPAAGTLDNTARISALGGSIDANSANNQASARITVTGPAPTPGPVPGPGPTPNPGATPGTPPVPVPVGAPWAIIGLLALLLAAHPASRAARHPAARQPHCKNKKP
ncbi:carboxypeptidase regulatory-like domain-containing protein [Vandammella animalimorsus]|nr:carboxypeptidase regulatory-like domain-containing protein [Vandammella animalimorsus]